VTFTVPASIADDDVLTVTVTDVRDPSTLSSSDSIRLNGGRTPAVTAGDDHDTIRHLPDPDPVGHDH
jgi:hypothetical protein